MRTFKDITKGNYISFNSEFDHEHADWLVLPTQHTRDSDCLEESNYAAALKMFGGESDTVVTVEHNHWACGWVGFILVRPSRKSEVEELIERLDTYPVLDDDDHSEREHQEADRVWADCYKPAERIAYIRKHRSQFDFHDMEDLMGCVRGKYFAGYASELIY